MEMYDKAATNLIEAIPNAIDANAKSRWYFLIGQLWQKANNINKAYYIISNEELDFVETCLSLNTIYPFYYEVCLYEKELIMIRENKLKKLNHFL